MGKDLMLCLRADGLGQVLLPFLGLQSGKAGRSDRSGDGFG